MVNLDLDYIVRDFGISKTKNGDSMGNLNLENPDNKDVLNCKIWNNILEDIDAKTFRTGNVVNITGKYNPEYKNCIVKSIEIVKEASIGHNEVKREELFKQIMCVIETFKDNDLKSKVKAKILENEELFKISPAARSMHHNYVGGLMQHIIECIDFAEAIFSKFKKEADKDLILAACIMHDIGKIYEYTVNLETGVCEISEDFKKEWISHTQYGFSWAMNNDLKLLARIIAAHHGRSEWDALIDLSQRNLEPELYLMSHIDDISAKFGLINVMEL